MQALWKGIRMCIGSVADTAAWLVGVPAVEFPNPATLAVVVRTTTARCGHICRRMRGDNTALLPRLGNCRRLCKVAATFECAKWMFDTPASVASSIRSAWSRFSPRYLKQSTSSMTRLICSRSCTQSSTFPMPSDSTIAVSFP